MGIHRGLNIVKDGLVFGYDTGYGVADNTTPTRFYPGKSTTNLLTSSGAASLDVRTDIYNNVTKTDLGNGKYRFVNDGTGGTTIRVHANVNDLVDGEYYGCSVSYEELNAGGYVHLDWCDTTNTSFTQASYGSANRIHIYGARSTYNSTFRFLDISLPVNGSVVLFDAQIESGRPSPFVNGTRSSTASLIDLKKTTDIDVSNVSFDSTGQPTFDGSDDEIQIASSDWNKVTEVTVEAIVLLKGTPIDGNGYHVVAQKDGAYSGGAVYGIRISGANVPYGIFSKDATVAGTHISTVAGTIMTTNKYYHLVYTRKVGESVFYQNGEQQSIITSSNDAIYNNTSTFTIGQGDGRQLYGNISVLKVYNSVLSSDEIKQNYNAYKNRFDI
jgi:hypothetical protein